MQTNLRALPPCLRLKLIGEEQLRHVFARDHYLLQPLASRHSRSLARARCISTPKLVTVTSRILQISPVSNPSTSRKTNATRWFTGRPSMQPRISLPISFESISRSKSAGGRLHLPLASKRDSNTPSIGSIRSSLLQARPASLAFSCRVPNPPVHEADHPSELSQPP